jgi:RHS repeat-associated protein
LRHRYRILHDGAARTPNQQPKSTIPLQNQFPNLRRRTLIDNTAPNGPRAYDLSFHSFGLDIDTYDYDAFGNLINSTGSTPNNYLFAGEQYDSALALYYNRARYLNTATGRFWSMDTEDGDDEEPASLHKYTYAEDNPVDNTDRSGNEIDEIAVAAAISVTLDAMPSVAQAGAAVTRQARFAALLRSYPSHADHSSDPKQPGNIWALIGGHVQMNAYNKGVVNNTCAIRMSYALNLSGWAIPKGSGTVSGADGSQYYLRVADLQGFLSTLFPKQTLPGGSFSGPSGVTGIISFNIPFGRNPVTGDRAGGHFALWTGQGLTDATESDYASWPAPTSTLFWRVN